MEGVRAKLRFLFLSTLVFLTGAGFHTAAMAAGAEAAIRAVRPPLVKVVDELDERHLLVDSVVARMRVTLKDNKKKKDYPPLEGVYLGDKDGNLRLRITTENGTAILDMAQHGEKLELSLPRKNRFFRGKRQDLLNNPQCELCIFAHVGKARDLFYPRAWSPNAVERRVSYKHGREVISVIEKPGIIRHRTRKLVIAPDSPVVESIDVSDRLGKDIGRVVYSDYRSPDKAEDNPHAGVLGLIFPNHIVFESLDGAHTLEMEVEEIHLNEQIGEERFDLPPPENGRILDLGFTLKKNAALWE